MMNDKKMRFYFGEILGEVTCPSHIKNIDCLRTLSDIIRFILTLYLHENNIEYRLFSVILESS